jgi:hypothetical protein
LLCNSVLLLALALALPLPLALLSIALSNELSLVMVYFLGKCLHIQFPPIFSTDNVGAGIVFLLNIALRNFLFNDL